MVTGAMKIKYFQDTDTLYIEFRADRIAEARDLDEDSLLLKERGQVHFPSVDGNRQVNGKPWWSEGAAAVCNPDSVWRIRRD